MLWTPDTPNTKTQRASANTITMSDYYTHFLSSMVGVAGPPNPAQLDGSGQLPQPPVVPMGGSPATNPYQSLGYFTGFPEPIMFNASKAQRSRRKSAPGLDHIKHRRTRSGCYTCRSRRVKVIPHCLTPCYYQDLSDPALVRRKPSRLRKYVLTLAARLYGRDY